jgi:hypothetical protein
MSSLRPHRAGAVLTLGILGFFCLVCAIIAWVMGTGDLKEMRAGRMDPSGESTTNTGRILGMVFTLLGVVGLVIALATGAFTARVSRY